MVSAAWDDVFYVETADRSSGIRAEKTGHGLSPGTGVELFGVVRTNAHGERYVDSPSVTPADGGSIKPLGMRGSMLGGGDFGYEPGPPEAGQRGVTGGSGLNNVGLLVRAWGRIVERDTTWFTINDGSGVNVKCLLPSGAALDPGYTFVGVTGISSCEKVVDEFHRLLLVRVQEDITPF